MLKRIKTIQNVGTFSDCRAANIGLDKLTLIYGRNTFGKSTLGDIFSSLQHNQPDLIERRASIPATGKPALVELQFGDGTQPTTVVKFKDGQWPAGHSPISGRIKVFNDVFFHSHVFAGQAFTRDTKEKFSEFVLGAKGVAVANQIAEQKQLKRKTHKRIEQLTKDAFGGIDEVDSFINMTPSGDLMELTERQQRLAEQKGALQKQLADSMDIQRRGTLRVTQLDMLALQRIEDANEIFATTLETHHHNARMSLAQHVAQHPVMTHDHASEMWLRQGLRYHNGKSCQFCGQTLNEQALDLFTVYQQCFDEAFERHADYVLRELHNDRLYDERMFTTRIKESNIQNQGVLQSYPELFDKPTFAALFDNQQAVTKGMDLTLEEFEVVI